MLAAPSHGRFVSARALGLTQQLCMLQVDVLISSSGTGPPQQARTKRGKHVIQEDDQAAPAYNLMTGMAGSVRSASINWDGAPHFSASVQKFIQIVKLTTILRLAAMWRLRIKGSGRWR